MTLVFVFNGNAYSEATPNGLTAQAAGVLRAAGHRVVQLAYPAISSARAIQGVAGRIASISQGQPIALVGFSAGGTLATRLSAIPSLNVTAVLNNYGPPDLREWLDYHGRDMFGQYVRSRVPFTPDAVDMLSGPSDSKAYIVSAFGARDRNVTAAQSSQSMESNFPGSKVYIYPGGHGASIAASRPALQDFLSRLSPSTAQFSRHRFRRRS